ncbi:MULE domain-containing protein, partial [Aphis craccivora]
MAVFRQRTPELNPSNSNDYNRYSRIIDGLLFPISLHLTVETAFYENVNIKFKKVSIMSENIEVITSNRGNIMLIYKNFKFIHAYTSKDSITRWRCYEKKCTAKIFTKTNYVLVKVEGSHAADHSAIDRFLIDRQIINSACKRKAVEDVSMRPKKIILREIGQSSCTTISVNDVDRVRKNMYESRRKILPANPTSIQSVHDSLRNMNILTKQGEPFLLLNDDSKNVLIFSCAKNLNFLCDVQTIYMDGTFQYSARFFTQMFTIHGYKNGHYVPLVFCLLHDKKTETYIYMLQKISELCDNMGRLFLPTNITSDFEKAILNAVYEVWPGMNVVGCRFHLTQAWYRQIQSLGLITEYKNKCNIGMWLRHTFGLLFLNPSE